MNRMSQRFCIDELSINLSFKLSVSSSCEPFGIFQILVLLSFPGGSLLLSLGDIRNNDMLKHLATDLSSSR